MPKLTTKEFEYYKDAVKDDEKAHGSMLDVQMPDKILDAYEGKMGERAGDEFKLTGDMIEDYMLIAVNTLVPTLFYQVPRPMVRGKRKDLHYSASVLNGLIQAYFTDRWKTEIQNCIIDAYLPYPSAVIKTGYNTRMGKVQAKPSILTGQINAPQSSATHNMEASEEYLKFEAPFIERHSPRFTYLDTSKEFGKGMRVTFEYERTLQELIDSNLYQLSTEFIDYFTGRTGDKRKAKLKIKEHFCLKPDGVYKLVYSDAWHDELSFGKTVYTKLPYELLRFNRVPDRVYTTSHGRLAYEAQKELQYQNEIWKQHIDKIRRQHLVWTDALTESGKASIKHNEIDGIIECSKPVTAGVYAQISSNPMGKDVYAGIDNVRNYLKLLLSTSGGRGGETDTEFAYTEKQQAVGDYMRMSGLQDEIRGFVRGTLKKVISNLVKYGNPEVTIQITGKDVIDPITGELITGKEMVIGGESGLDIRDEIKGDVELDYIYDIDIMSASKPDFAVMRKQMGEFLTIVTNPVIEQKLLAEGKKFNVSEFVQDMANTFEALADPQKYISELSEEEKMVMAMQMQGGQAMPQGETPAMSGPTDETMAQGLEQEVMP